MWTSCRSVSAADKSISTQTGRLVNSYRSVSLLLSRYSKSNCKTANDSRPRRHNTHCLGADRLHARIHSLTGACLHYCRPTVLLPFLSELAFDQPSVKSLLLRDGTGSGFLTRDLTRPDPVSSLTLNDVKFRNVTSQGQSARK